MKIRDVGRMDGHDHEALRVGRALIPALLQKAALTTDVFATPLVAKLDLT